MSKKTSVITSSGIGAALIVGTITSTLFGDGVEFFILLVVFILLAAPVGDWLVGRTFADLGDRTKLSLAGLCIIFGIIYAIIGK